MSRIGGETEVVEVARLLRATAKTLEGRHEQAFPSAKLCRDGGRRSRRRGGVLIADAETSLFDSDGHQQQDFQLADVFGASLAAQCSADRGHLHVEDQAFQASQPWGESTLPMTEGQWGVKAAAGARVLGTVRANPGLSLVSVLVATGEPAFLLSPCGTGRCYYFAGAIGRQYRRYGQANVFQLMRKVLAAAAGTRSPRASARSSSVSAPGAANPCAERCLPPTARNCPAAPKAARRS